MDVTLLITKSHSISLPGFGGISRGNRAIFYDSINHDAREGKDVIPRGTPVIIYASCHEQDEGPGSHYVSKPPVMLPVPDAVSEESIPSAPFPHRGKLPTAGSNLTNVFPMRNHLRNDAITRRCKYIVVYSLTNPRDQTFLTHKELLFLNFLLIIASSLSFYFRLYYFAYHCFSQFKKNSRRHRIICF